MRISLFVTVIFSASLFLSACSGDNEGNSDNFVEGVCIKKIGNYKKCVASSISYTSKEECEMDDGEYAKKCPEKADIQCPYTSPQISFIEYFYWITDEAKANPSVSSCNE